MNYFKNILFTFLIAFPFGEIFSQSGCPMVNAGPDVTICGGCTNLTALIQGSVTTTSYTGSVIPYTPYPFYAGNSILIGTDDQFSDTVVLPFCFQFYGATSTKCVAGSNGIINFDYVANANNYNTWPVSAAVPCGNACNGPDIVNCIMAPWHDLDPSVAGNCYFQLLGSAPCRTLVVSWDSVALFSCNNLICTQQIVLYETTNIIEVYIRQKQTCTTWNGGCAIEGVLDQLGATGTIVPGRNYPTQWSVNNDAYRFTPAGVPQYTFQWLQNNVPIGNTPTINVCPTVTTTYVAQVVNQTCNGPVTVTDTVKVIVGNGSLTVATSSTPSPCTGNSGTATATPTGNAPFTYLWTPGGQTIQTATGLAPGTYSVTVTDANGCQGTQTVVVASSSGLTATSTFHNITCHGANDGTGTVTPVGGTGPFTYQWSPAGGNTATATGLIAGTYTVTVTDANGCIAVVNIVIIEPPLLTITITASANTTCGFNNGSANSNAVGGTAPLTYAWTPAGGNAANASNLASGTYTVTVTDASGCTDTATVTISPSVGVPCSFSGVDTTGCSPLCVTFTNTSLAATSCSWSFGDNTTSALCNTNHCYTTPGTYSVSLVITSASGCTAIATHAGMVKVYPNPVAAFTMNPPIASEYSPTIQFTSTSIGATTWAWTFGDTAHSTSNVANPIFTYSDTGHYVVTLLVTNANGCRDSITEVVYIAPEFTFYAPNAFTPNNDGLNEIFLPKGSDLDGNTYTLYIFDRWGNNIFKTTDMYKGWDGRANGGSSIAQEDTYVWKVYVTDLLGHKHQFVGSVSLIK